VLDQSTDLSRCAIDDVIATDVSKKGEKCTRNVNVEDQNDTQLGERERPAPKLNRKRVIRQGGTALAGDFNAHCK